MISNYAYWYFTYQSQENTFIVNVIERKIFPNTFFIVPWCIPTYNSTHHSAIGMAPRVVNWINQWGAPLGMPVLATSAATSRAGGRHGRLHLLPSDRVRMSKSCHQFTKGYKSHWSKEIFRTEAMWDMSPMTYVVANAAGKSIRGTFYSPELQKVMPWDYFGVEAILDTRWRGNTTPYLIKWAGYPDSFNCWESHMVWINVDSVMPQQQCHCGFPVSGLPVFIAPRYGESSMRSTQLHGFHIAQQCQPGAVPRKHHHKLQGRAARAHPAAW